MKLTTATTTTTTTKTGTITVADIRKKFRIPDSATVTIGGDGNDIILTVTHVVEAAK